MNEIQLFTDGDFNMRTAVVDGEPLFCLVDVCKVLDIQNPSKVAQRLDDDERTKLELGRQGETNFITESGLYAVILRSDKPNAKGFRRWVTSEVLPSIRKTGNYSAKPMTTEEKIKLLAQGNTELAERVDRVEDKIGSIATLGGNDMRKNWDTIIIRALCTVIGALMYVGMFIIPIGLDVIRISLPLWLKLILIIIMGGLIMVAVIIDEKMQIIEEERNGRKEKLG